MDGAVNEWTSWDNFGSVLVPGFFPAGVTVMENSMRCFSVGLFHSAPVIRYPHYPLAALGLLGLAMSAAGETVFNRDILPIFSAHCIACHGGVYSEGNVSFVVRELALGIGNSGQPTIVPGEPDTSV